MDDAWHEERWTDLSVRHTESAYRDEDEYGHSMSRLHNNTVGKSRRALSGKRDAPLGTARPNLETEEDDG